MDLAHSVKKKLLSLGIGLESAFLVGVSGGADSTALLLSMMEVTGSRGALTAAHLDHGMRPGSDEDGKRVLDLCGDLGIRVVMGRLDPQELETKRRQHRSLEAAMRVLRYRFLKDAAEKSASQWILTGHTADDQAETILFRAARGMDWRSLGAIPEKRGEIIRPLLETPRSATWEYCITSGITPLVDPSNYDDAYSRSKIRHSLLPALESELHPDVHQLLLRTGHAAGRLNLAEKQLLERSRPGCEDDAGQAMDRGHLLDLPEILRKRHIVDFLFDRFNGFPSRELVRDVLDFITAGRNGRLFLPDGMQLVLTCGKARVLDHAEVRIEALPAKGLELKVPGRLVFASAGITVTASLCALETPGEYPAGNTALISRQCFSGPLWVRKRQPGDRFIPIGMTKNKKLKDLLVDRKVPREQRDRIPVVTDDRGDILWVGGIEISRKAALEGVKGEKAVRLHIEELSHGVKPGKATNLS